MKKLLLSVAALLLSLVAVSLVAQAPPQGQATGSARQTPINGSGIQSEILFLDTGSNVNGLVVSGKASGLDPTQTYFSLLYNNGSVPGGPNACVPSASGAPITGAQMFTAFWTVASDGTGTLFRQKTGTAYVLLSDVATMSIRKVAPANPPFFNVLEACGEIQRNP